MASQIYCDLDGAVTHLIIHNRPGFRRSALGARQTNDVSYGTGLVARPHDWEISIDETPVDLWSLQGELDPPFESVAEKRWVKEDKASFYTAAEKLPVNMVFAPGIADK